MNNIESIVNGIKKLLKENAPKLSNEQKTRVYKILNPDISNYMISGIKIPEIEKIVKQVYEEFKCSYNDAINIFKILIKNNVEEEKFAGFFFLNRYKKYFNEEIINLFKKEYSEHCHTWSLCDSTCVRVIGPFLGKKENEILAKRTIDGWSNSTSKWIKRASMVILLKITMLRKNFDEKYVFDLAEKMLEFSDQNYIEKGIGWLLKTCSKYKPDVIFDYLMKNKAIFSRLILRYASEKLPKENRVSILKK